MPFAKQLGRLGLRSLIGGALLFLGAFTVPAIVPVKPQPQSDSFVAKPAPDLALQRPGQRKADALLRFVVGERLEEMGEVEKAIASYLKVLTVDPGQIDLALHVADLLSQQDDYPQAIDVLKDAIKAKPAAAEPYLQLALFYARDLKKLDQGLRYAHQALELDPKNIDVYQRLFEIEMSAGNSPKALQALDEAARVQIEDPDFWAQLGKLYATVVFQNDATPKKDEIERVNTFFRKAARYGADKPEILKDVANYFAASGQIREAIPFYLKVLDLAPDDVNALEKLANGFVLTNQWPQAIKSLEEIISAHPEKGQNYELLASVYEDEGRAFERKKESDKAMADFRRAAQNYEQSLLINPTKITNYLRLGQLLLGRLQDYNRSLRMLQEAHRRFPDVPEITYYLALAQTAAKQPKIAVATFEEALHEAELATSDIINARFYFDYGAAAEQAGLYDKAADLFKRSIAIDPKDAAQTYNYLGYMWAEQNTHLEEAEAMIKHALDLDPKNGAYLDSLGWVHYRRGHYNEALDKLLLALKQLPQPDATVLEHVGDAYAKLSKMPQALEYWERAAALDKQNKNLASKIETARTKMSQGPPVKNNSP